MTGSVLSNTTPPSDAPPATNTPPVDTSGSSAPSLVSSTPPATSTTPSSDAPPATNTPPVDTPAAANTPPVDTANDWAAIKERIANGDEKLLQRLSRYSTLEAALKGGIEAQNKLGSLKPLQPIGKDSTPEEIAEYRKAHGIPDAPEGYELNLPEGIVLGDDDKPIADNFLKLAHEHNIPPAAVNAIIANHLQQRDKQIQEQAEFDYTTQLETEKELSSENVWGRETKVNVNLINQMLSSAPPGVKENLEHARLPNGKLLGNDTDTLVYLATLAREVNPYATLTGSRDDALPSIQAEMQQLEKLMGDHSSEYWKGPSAGAKQKRYLELVELKSKIQGR